MCLVLGGLGLGGCAQRPQDVATAHGKEYFPSSIYCPASKRVIVDGQPVPRGGGQYLVGKPYTIAGRTYYPTENSKTQIGYASWYGDAFHGRLTANGEGYDRDAFTAASPTMPLPSYARVTNLRNNYSMIVRVNDRGPYASDRIMDVSRRVAEALDYQRHGTALLKVEYVGRASLAGSDDARLYATLRRDQPGVAPQTDRTMVAQTAHRIRLAVRSSDGNEPSVSRRAFNDNTLAPSKPRERLITSDSRDVLPSHQVVTSHQKGSSASRAELDPLSAPRRTVDRGRWEIVDLRPKGMATLSSRIKDSSKTLMPPSRPMDLGTIPGAGSQIHARRDQPRFRVARSRQD